MESIPLALLLRADHRRPGDIERAAGTAAGLGLEITGHGRTSISARASPALFGRLFGIEAEALPAVPPGKRDAGRPAGWTVAGPLPVPAELSDLVMEIAVTPPADRL
ncbi:MAG TPA: hypothetical protein PKA13_11905 [Geminicoccaceae bacterium]|nr:hypothetical protein [Geminicoccus sp.]HMU50470.1 hypothetical protein [Geminicoccaceae bacterium]